MLEEHFLISRYHLWQPLGLPQELYPDGFQDQLATRVGVLCRMVHRWGNPLISLAIALQQPKKSLSQQSLFQLGHKRNIYVQSTSWIRRHQQMAEVKVVDD